jgi:phenylpropionate dioxygenase-like ring-hydroxylating dioxygenase large terminal subunit
MRRARNDLIEEIDKAIDQGRTLPSHWYRDPDILEIEQKAVFDHEWLYVGNVRTLGSPGDFFTAHAGQTPVVVVRDLDGTLRAHVNSCRHRGHEVAQGDGSARSLTCQYHGFNYALDGSLRHAPGTDALLDFDRCKWSLVPMKLDLWGPLVFVNRDLEAPSFMQTYPELPKVAEETGWAITDEHILQRVHQYEPRANWKLAVDNFIECTHCATVHPQFARTYHVHAPDYRYFEYTNFSYQTGPARHEHEWGDFRLYFLRPNLTLVRAGGAGVRRLDHRSGRGGPLADHGTPLFPRIGDRSADGRVLRRLHGDHVGGHRGPGVRPARARRQYAARTAAVQREPAPAGSDLAARVHRPARRQLIALPEAVGDRRKNASQSW